MKPAEIQLRPENPGRDCTCFAQGALNRALVRQFFFDPDRIIDALLVKSVMRFLPKLFEDL